MTATLPNANSKVVDLRWTDSKDLNSKLDKLLSGPDPATAFFCAHDGLAVTIMSELMARNLRIPADASVIGYGNYLTSQHVRPPMTTVDVPGAAFGREAVRLVRQRMTNPEDSKYSVRIQVPSKIIFRETFGKAKS